MTIVLTFENLRKVHYSGITASSSSQLQSGHVAERAEVVMSSELVSAPIATYISCVPLIDARHSLNQLSIRATHLYVHSELVFAALMYMCNTNDAHVT